MRIISRRMLRAFCHGVIISIQGPGQMIGFRIGASRAVRDIIRAGGMATIVFSLAPACPAHPSTTGPTAKQKQEKAPQEPSKANDAAQTFTLVGAGDIATCKHLQSAEATAK